MLQVWPAWLARRQAARTDRERGAEATGGVGFGRLASALIVRMSEKELLRAFAAEYRARAAAVGGGAKEQAQSGVG